MRAAINKAKDDLKKFYRLAPYDSPMNYNAHDGYFGMYIKNQYSEEVLQKAKVELESGLGFKLP